MAESFFPSPLIQNLLNHLPGMVYRRRPEPPYPLQLVSAGCEVMVGYPAERLGEGGDILYLSLIDAEDRAAVVEQITAAVARQEQYQITYRLVDAAGKRRWLREVGEGVRGSHGRLIALEGFVVDVTVQTASMHLLEQRVGDRTRKLVALYSLLEAASASDDLDAILQQSLERLRTAVHAQVAFIHALDRTTRTLHLVVQDGLPADVRSRLVELEPEVFDIDQLLERGGPLYIPDVQTDGRFDALNLPAEIRICYLGVPIVRKERVFGILSVIHADDNQFSPEDIGLLTSVGEQLGVTIEDALLRQKSSEMAVIAERNRLARELHDSVTQSLYSVTLFAEAGRRLAEAGRAEQAAAYFGRIGEAGEQALREMRLLVHKLRPSILVQEGLVAALRQRLAAVEGRAGIQYSCNIDEQLQLSAELEEVIFHIVQEALNNAMKHAHAGRVSVRVQPVDEGVVQVEVIDDGRGFDLEQGLSSGGLGLTSMRERAEMVGGSVCYHAEPGEGTRVHARLPLASQTERRRSTPYFEI